MSLSLFFIFLIIAIPCFFTGCNLAVTSYCPAKLEEFHGHIYNKAIVKRKNGCKRGKGRRYTCYEPILYAITQNNNTCDLNIDGEAFAFKSYAKNKLQPYKINQPVFWYKKHNSNQCLQKEYIIASWYAGIIFFGLAAIALFIFAFYHYFKCNRYFQKLPTSTPNLYGSINFSELPTTEASL